MAEEEKDTSQRTEEPSERRKEKAREEGQVAMSKEILAWSILLAGAITLVGMGPLIVVKLKQLLTPFIEKTDDFILNPTHLQDLLRQVAIFLMGILAVPFLIYIVAALLGGFLQTNFNISLKRIAPSFDKISIMKGFGRLFSLKSVVETIKACLKIAVVSVLVYMVLKPLVFGGANLQQEGIEGGLISIHAGTKELFMWLLSVTAIIVGGDFLYQRFSMLKELRMTRQEVKEELKESEGDPHIKQRIKQIRVQRLRKRMMAAVPSATVVVTNPTHFAVALKYDFLNRANAPVVVAKGMDFLAQKIREIATANHVEIVENPPLARSLYDNVEIDEEIPGEYYKAVAEVIRYVMQQKGIKI